MGPQPLGHGPVLVCGLLGTRSHSRRWVAGERAKLHLYLEPLPIARIIAWAPPPVRSAAALDSHRSTNPTTVYCACEGSRLRSPYENLMPDDLRWSWGGDGSAEERLQIQIIISREVWLHRDHNKSIACRLISKPYQWVASDNLAASGGRLYSGKWVDALQLYSCSWWQALSQNLTLILVCVRPAHYFIYQCVHASFPHCTLVSVTVLGSPQATTSQNK